jgi:hypothetical protein
MYTISGSDIERGVATSEDKYDGDKQFVFLL